MTVAPTAAAASSLPSSLPCHALLPACQPPRPPPRKQTCSPSFLPSLAHFPQRSGERGDSPFLSPSLAARPLSSSPPSGEFKHGALCTLRVTKRVPRQLTKDSACSCPSWTDTIAVSPLICSATERIAWQRRETVISLSCNTLAQKTLHKCFPPKTAGSFKLQPS